MIQGSHRGVPEQGSGISAPLFRPEDPWAEAVGNDLEGLRLLDHARWRIQSSRPATGSPSSLRVPTRREKDMARVGARSRMFSIRSVQLSIHSSLGAQPGRGS